jgi:hypothetical protein
MSITDRYATAIRSSCLTVDIRTTYSDTDVLGAMGLGAQALEATHPLAFLLNRLFVGDNHASVAIVEHLAELVRGKALSLHIKMPMTQAIDVARACLAWHRDGSCKPCGGHGTLVIRGSNTLGPQNCKHCRGDGKIPFERQFRPELREIAAWLVTVMEREMSRAGPAAMQQLSGYLEMKMLIADVS